MERADLLKAAGALAVAGAMYELWFRPRHLQWGATSEEAQEPLPVVLVEPKRALVFGSNTSELGTWGLYLKPLDENSSRLSVRSRVEWKPGPLRWAFNYFLFEPAHFLMERKMMLTLKYLAERSAQARTTLSPLSSN